MLKISLYLIKAGENRSNTLTSLSSLIGLVGTLKKNIFFYINVYSEVNFHKL